MRYCGWIPTITGNLSFSTIGLGRNPKRIFQSFRAFEDVRLVVCAQKRRTTDIVFGSLGEAVNRLIGREGTFIFALFGECSATQGFREIKGVCVLLSPRRFRDLNKHHLAEIKRAGSEGAFRTAFSNALQSFVKHKSDGPKSVAQFSLMRDGKFTVELDSGAHTENEMPVIASQLYSFVRDVCHVHQHHEPSVDTILDVHPLEPSLFRWKRETLYSHFRWIIARKRSKATDGLLSAKGVLAYASAFHTLHVLKSSDKKHLPEYSFESVRLSIESAIESNHYRQSKNFDLGSAIFNRSVPLMILFATLLPIFLPEDSVVNGGAAVSRIREVSFFALNHFPSIAAFILLSPLMYELGWVRRRQFSTLPIIKDIRRLLYSIHRSWALIILLLFFFLLFTVGISLVLFPIWPEFLILVEYLSTPPGN